jgi:histone-lysine N-methyltransferase ASH1L
MSFEQNMIIDATTGSIARFVNHSCNPNCKMVKWVVAGQPRMALFAGDRPIMTGDELTYDYNFDPFSAKNVQSCLCGEPNCRGILGPRTREQKAKPELQKKVKNAVKAGKRKLQEMMGNEPTSSNKPKRPRITSTKEALATVGLQMAKGTATAIKKTASSVASNAKKAVRGTKTPAQRRANASAVLKKTATSRVVKAYGKKGTTKKQISSRSTSTVTAKGKGVKAVKKTTVKKTTAKGTTTKTKTTATKSSSVTKVTKARGLKRPIAPAGMTAAEKKRKEELDRQYEITVAHPD